MRGLGANVHGSTACKEVSRRFRMEGMGNSDTYLYPCYLLGY